MTFRWTTQYKLEITAFVFCFLVLFYLSGIPNTVFFSDTPKTFSYGPLSEKEPEQLFILLHNANGSGPGIMRIGLYYAAHFPDAVFIAPEGPKPARLLPYHHTWFYRWLEKTEEMESKVNEAIPYLRNHIEKAMEHYNIPAERTVLIGSSQGGVMALHAALNMDKKFAAVVSISGYIAGTDIPHNSALENTSVLLLHGAEDTTIPREDFFKTLQILKDHGYKATGELIQGAGHQINGPMLDKGLRLLKKTLKEKEQ